MRQKFIDYIREQYGVEEEYPWSRYDDNCIWRHSDNGKWFALMMDVRRDKLGLEGKDRVTVMNLKIDDMILRDMVLARDGIMPAYHMNKLHWITVLLDGTVPEDDIRELIEVSYRATAPKRRVKDRPAKEWIVPANPKYYDVEGAFEANDEIEWKQGSGINVGDTVYIYVASPVSAIRYRCKVLETDIPYDYSDSNLTIKALMKIRLLKRYDPDEFTFETLREEYGVNAIRGPRGVPYSLSEALSKS